jgi:predicted dehydrogenase
MLKIGVVGAGHLGKIHIRLLLELADIFEFVGFYDVDSVNSQSVTNQFNIKSFPSISELINEVDCLDIVTPTLSHYACAFEALRARKHIFIEKPLSETMEEAKKMVMLTNEAEVIVQVGHVERFNPAFQAALPYLKNPMFIETHRLAQFNPRGTDVPVVLDLMIHDIDIILSVVKSRVKNIAASGVSVVSESHDITNARLEFENGCVANLTASRISLKNMRKSRFFQKDTYISVDFLTKELEVVSIEDIQGEPDPFDIILEIGKENKRKKILIDKPELAEVNAIREELIAFHDAIINKKHPIVSVEDGFSAMEVAYGILSKLEKSPIHF